jgi:hypothetical protein
MTKRIEASEQQDGKPGNIQLDAESQPPWSYRSLEERTRTMSSNRAWDASKPTKHAIALSHPLALWLSCLPPTLNLFLAIVEKEKARKSFRNSRTQIHDTLALNGEFFFNPNALESHGHIWYPRIIS